MEYKVNKRRLGKDMERLATDFLRKNGYTIRRTNFTCNAGEIDIIGENEGYLCFIEVKYRASLREGYPEEAVDSRKAGRISRAALYYINYCRLDESIPCRFDVVAILGSDIRLIKNAFDACF